MLYVKQCEVKNQWFYEDTTMDKKAWWARW